MNCFSMKLSKINIENFFVKLCPHRNQATWYKLSPATSILDENRALCIYITILDETFQKPID